LDPLKDSQSGATDITRYEFGPYELDLSVGRLHRQGEVVALPPKAFDTLVALVRRAGRLVEKAELMKELWPDTFVEESNLAQQVFTLRRLLGEQPNGRPYIDTVPKRGYLFAAPIRRPDSGLTASPREPAPPSQSAHVDSGSFRAGRRSAVLVAIAIAVLAAAWVAWRIAQSSPDPPSAFDATRPSSVAILPFRDLTGSDGAPLGLGMADALITRLASLHGIVIRPTGSVVRYADVEDPLRAGRDLRVTLVLDGRIQRAGERVRITTQLLRVADGSSVWGQTFDEPVSDIFRLQDSIAERVAAALVPSLTTEERARVARRQTNSTDAYRSYVLGRHHWSRRTEDDLRKSAEYFQEAVSKDPQYALAYAGLADAYNILGNFSAVRPEDAYPLAQRAARTALEIDPGLAEAQVALVFSEFLYERKWSEADTGFRRAIDVNPHYAPAHQWYGVYLSSAQRHDEAIAELRRATELDPPSPVLHSVLAWVLYAAGRYDEAVAQCQAIEQMAPGFPLTHLYLGQSLVQKGEFASAVDAFRLAGAVSGGSARVLSEQAHALAVGGQRNRARRILAELQARARGEYVDAHGLALIKVGLGDRAGAIEMLERAERERFPWLVRLGVEPRWAPLHDERRFRELMRRVGIPGL
jgi:DNA-binding winged helix-turn-helix (wHTH) protein/TolB-like protein/Tfp pilus assembly protein PilF